MAKSNERKLIVGLDIGTSKVCALVGEILANGELSIVGVGNHASRGMDKGGVNDLDSIVRCVQRAVQEAELMADCQIASVYLSISGRHIKCQNENGMVSINGEEVTQEDVDNVIHTAKSIPISDERRLLHVLPQEFSIDSQEDIKSPIGMNGMRMEAKVHLITCANDMARNTEKVVERCGLQVESLIFSALAASDAALTEDEKELGVCVVDMGGGTIDLVVYANGAIRHTAVIPVAGNQVTSDIAKIFRTPLNHAEEIKVQYACAQRQLVNMQDTIEVASVGGRQARTMSRHTLAEVVEPRYHELFELINEELKGSGLADQIAAGVVLTGGTAKIEGAIELAEDIFQMPVRLGQPQEVKGLYDYVSDPSYATAVGLLHYGMDDVLGNTRERTGTEKVASLWSTIHGWFKGEF